MGASGSGKTTLLNLIATIDKPTSGMIEINGQSIIDISEIHAPKQLLDTFTMLRDEYGANILEKCKLVFKQFLYRF